MTRWLLVVLAVAGGCGKRRTPTTAPVQHDAGDAGLAHDADADADAEPARDAAALDAAPLAGTGSGYRVVALTDDEVGAVKVTVTWPTAPAAARRSPGRTTCGGARPPQARIATLHGVADVVIVLDLDHGKPAAPAAPVRVTVRDCAVAPTVALAPGLGGALVVDNGAVEPATVTITAVGPAWRLPPTATALARAQLPVLGHAVAVTLAEAGAIEVGLAGEADPAVVIAPPHPYVAITDATGAARLTRVPTGTYPVRAWLPGRAGAAARTVTGEVTVVAGDEAALALELTP